MQGLPVTRPPRLQSTVTNTSPRRIVKEKWPYAYDLTPRSRFLGIAWIARPVKQPSRPSGDVLLAVACSLRLCCLRRFPCKREVSTLAGQGLIVTVSRLLA